jgi:hypothetical protein
LGIDDAVDILYNTVVVNGYQERMWVGASMVRVGPIVEGVVHVSR